MNIADIRKEYTLKDLDLDHVTPDPVAQFQQWFDEALNASLPEPNAMTLSTVGENGRPTARVVLLKGIENRQFIFYTNYQSRKGRDMAANPYVSLVFFWPELERQVRIEGKVEKVAPEISDAYFKSRPKTSRIGAHASPQSQEIPNRFFIEKKAMELMLRYAVSEVPRPAHWGGYGVTPDHVEFWQGRPSRLHDRIAYTLQPDGNWKISRLAP
jgi:pyridoxamine 5'-phosphate oxidase